MPYPIFGVKNDVFLLRASIEPLFSPHFLECCRVLSSMFFWWRVSQFRLLRLPYCPVGNLERCRRRSQNDRMTRQCADAGECANFCYGFETRAGRGIHNKLFLAGYNNNASVVHRKGSGVTDEADPCCIVVARSVNTTFTVLSLLKTTPKNEEVEDVRDMCGDVNSHLYLSAHCQLIERRLLPSGA